MTKKEFEDIYRQHFAKMYRLARTMLYDADERKQGRGKRHLRPTVTGEVSTPTEPDGRLPDDCRAQPLSRRAQPQVDAGTGGKALLAGVDAEPDRFDE